MKCFHLSDLHLGKRLNEQSLVDDQRFIISQIITQIDNEQPDAVFIAGDIYDKSIPPVEAVILFDQFLVAMMNRSIPVFVISGNHDSPERISFGSKIMESGNIYLSPIFSGNIEPITLQDEFGEVNVYMFPFIKPANVRPFYEEEISSYTDAMEKVIATLHIDKSQRNILITHQFVIGAERTESEEISVGGTDGVSGEIFSDFDYVALGHIHRAQKCGSGNIRYCGTPLKYSFSESKDQKSITVVELAEKGNISVRQIPLTPKHDLIEIKGTYEELSARSFYDGTTLREDYVHVTLTDEQDIPDAIGKLRTIYHNLLKLDYENRRTQTNQVIEESVIDEKSPLDLLEELFFKQNNVELDEMQSSIAQAKINEIWEENV